jgi:hypothetical protein
MCGMGQSTDRQTNPPTGRATPAQIMEIDLYGARAVRKLVWRLGQGVGRSDTM